MTDRLADEDTTTRRHVLRALAASGLTGLAGCGFGEDGDGTTVPPITTLPPERTRTETGTTTPTTTTTTETETPTNTTTTDPLVEGRTWRLFVPSPLPENVHYNPKGGQPFWWDGELMMRIGLFRRSLIDMQFRGEAANTWRYENGVLTAEVHDDLYWVSDSESSRTPVNVTAQDWVSSIRLQPDSRVERIEPTGDYGFQVFFSDPLAQRYALADRSASGFNESYTVPWNSTFWRPYLDRLEDTSTDETASEIRADATQRTVTSPHPVSNMPFRVASVEEDRWMLTLRDDEPNTPRWVADLTYPSVEVVVEADITRETAAFREGRLPLAGVRPAIRWTPPLVDEFYTLPEPFDPAVIDIDVDFPTSTLTLPRTSVPGAYIMNRGRHPADNVHFRRAFAYLLDRTAHLTRFMSADRVITGFTTEQDEQRYVSPDLLEVLRNGPHDNYGVASVLTDNAEAEMMAGGFARDSAGNWLYQSGEQEGEPISLEIPALPWMDRLVDASGDFTTTLTEFGIESTVYTVEDSRALDQQEPSYTVALSYWGGRLPWDVFFSSFYQRWWDDPEGDEDAPWTGPPLGEFATPPAVATDNTQSLDLDFLIGELQSVEGGRLRETVDKLAWVCNQALPKVPIGHQPYIWTVNTRDWEWPLPSDDHPDVWTSIPRRKLWQRGFVEAVPTEDE